MDIQEAHHPHPDPSPDEIRRQCWAIQATWPPSERRKRAPWAYAQEAVELRRFAAADSVDVPECQAG